MASTLQDMEVDSVPESQRREVFDNLIRLLEGSNFTRNERDQFKRWKDATKLWLDSTFKDLENHPEARTFQNQLNYGLNCIKSFLQTVAKGESLFGDNGSIRPSFEPWRGSYSATAAPYHDSGDRFHYAQPVPRNFAHRQVHSQAALSQSIQTRFRNGPSFGRTPILSGGIRKEKSSRMSERRKGVADQFSRRAQIERGLNHPSSAPQSAKPPQISVHPPSPPSLPLPSLDEAFEGLNLDKGEVRRQNSLRHFKPVSRRSVIGGYDR